MTEPTGRTEPKRDRWGRYIIPDPTTGEEREWTRATTLAGVLPDRYNLERWGERMVAYGLGKREDLVVLTQSVQDPKSYDGKRRLNKIAKDAKDAAQAGSRANIGTAIHTFTELVDQGGAPEIPKAYRPDIEAYLAVKKELGVEVLATEQIVVNVEIGVAGTFDRLVRVKGFDLPVIWDIKTGGTVDFSHLEHAVQLGIYANSPYSFDVATGDVHGRELGELGSALIVHLPAGSGECTVHEINIARGWELAKVAKEVFEARKDRGLSRPFKVGA